AQFDLNGAIGRGAAMQVYTRALIDPSIEYLRALADVKYQFAWKVAQAQETYARDGNGDTLLGRLEFAESQRRAAERNVELAWYAVESAAQANKLLAEATIDRDGDLTLIAADVALAQARVQAESTYRQVESNVYVQVAQSWRAIDLVFSQIES